MKALLVVGIALLLIGGGLMVAGSFTVKDTDPVVEIGKLEITKTTQKRKPIPVAVSGSLLAAGLVLTVVAALKMRSK
jgi:hypothetical protein